MRHWQASRRPAGVEEHEQMNVRVPQELGKPCHFHGKIPAGVPGYQLRARCPADGGGESDEINRLHPWYHRATRTEAR